MEALARAVDHLQSLPVLDSQVNEKRMLLEFPERLEGHELIVGLGRPRVDLDAVLEGDHEELDTLVLDDLEVDAALELADVHPALLVLALRLEDLCLEP